MLAVDWTSVHLAGAFLIGTLFGTVVTLRIVRYVSTFLAALRRREDTD